MPSLPGALLSLTGASGSQGLLSPKNSWRVYVLPRGGYAAQDSTGTLITFDSAAVASRFAALNWIQVGLSTANIRQVAAVGGNSISVSGAALTVAQNARIFLIGNTQPTVSAGSATYTTPNTVIRQRDDDASDLYANSMVTTNADGLVQFFGNPALYDCIIQDSNQSNQGSIIDLAVGVVEGISTSTVSIFGATVTINAAFGITGWATFGQSATFNAAIGVTGWATFGSTVTMHAALGVTGTATFGVTTTTGPLIVNASSGHTFTVSGSGGLLNLATSGTNFPQLTLLSGVTATATVGTVIDTSIAHGSTSFVALSVRDASATLVDFMKDAVIRLNPGVGSPSLRGSTQSGAPGMQATRGSIFMRTDGTARNASVYINTSIGAGASWSYPRIPLFGASTINFGNVSPNSSKDLTFGVIGTVLGDIVALGLPSNLVANISGCAFVAAPDVVTLRLTNPTGATITVLNGQFSVHVYSQD